VTLLEPPAEEEEEEEGGEGSRQGAAAAAAGPGADARRAAAELRAKEKVDARLAAIGLAASTAVRGGGRTAMRAAQPGEACFSKNGEQQPYVAVLVKQLTVLLHVPVCGLQRTSNGTFSWLTLRLHASFGEPLDKVVWVKCRQGN
jgi:hypothetical protein